MHGTVSGGIQTIRRELVLPVPELSREGIRWRGGVRGRPLEVEIDFHNPGGSSTGPVSARIDIAPFGAFVPGEILATAAVPSLPPGGMWTFRTAIASDDLPDLGPGPITARESGSPRWEAPPVDPAVLRTTRPERSWTWRSLRTQLSDLTSWIQPDAHFIGNLNVFVTAGRPVERHVARAVKLKAGKPNFGMFCVGDGRRAEYRFHPAVCEPGWTMVLQPYGWDTPAPITHDGAVLLIVPPEKAESGRAAIRVDRVSTGESALVEFELDVRAGRSKCWFF